MVGLSGQVEWEGAHRCSWDLSQRLGSPAGQGAHSWGDRVLQVRVGVGAQGSPSLILLLQ